MMANSVGTQGAAVGRMSGKTVLVTGSTDGVGRQTAVDLAAMGATVIVHGRDPGRGAATLAAVHAAARAAGSGHASGLCLADLSSRQGVRALATQVRRRCDRLDVLINNAGVYAPRRVTTRDGLELTFAVNVVAPFLLTRELLPLLVAAAPARIVNLSSTSHWTGAMHWDDLQFTCAYDPHVSYEQSKLAMTLFTFELAQRLQGSGVTAVCLDPGNVDTRMLRAGWPDLVGIDLVAGAATSVALASSVEVEGLSGAYFESGRETAPPAAGLDRVAQARLWAVLEGMANGDV
jgi:NAD(P)-dependent dehydrogenase (short-subunit alcohol dehydrogenase family)